MDVFTGIRILEKTSSGPEIHGWEISTDAHLFQTDDVWDGAIFGVPGGPLGIQMPACADPVHLIQERRVIHDRGRCHQRMEDNPLFAPIDDIVVAVAQHRTAATGRMQSTI